MHARFPPLASCCCPPPLPQGRRPPLCFLFSLTASHCEQAGQAGEALAGTASTRSTMFASTALSAALSDCAAGPRPPLVQPPFPCCVSLATPNSSPFFAARHAAVLEKNKIKGANLVPVCLVITFAALEARRRRWRPSRPWPSGLWNSRVEAHPVASWLFHAEGQGQPAGAASWWTWSWTWSRRAAPRRLEGPKAVVKSKCWR